jgi:hypothetical protein
MMFQQFSGDVEIFQLTSPDPFAEIRKHRAPGTVPQSHVLYFQFPEGGGTVIKQCEKIRDFGLDLGKG